MTSENIIESDVLSLELSLSVTDSVQNYTPSKSEVKQIDSSAYPDSEKYKYLEIDSSRQFESLTENQKLYAHYLSDACWNGSLIVFFQTSAESPLILLFFLKLLLPQSLEELKKNSLENGVTEENYQEFLLYVARFFSNRGNYDRNYKFVPELHSCDINFILESSRSWVEERTFMQDLCKKILGAMFSLNSFDKCLSFPDTGVTTYYSEGCDKRDALYVKRYLSSKNVEGWNTRVIKIHTQSGIKYDIRLASVNIDNSHGYEKGPDSREFRITKGDYSLILSRVVEDLNKARDYATLEYESKMLDCYIRSFKTGLTFHHKEGSRLWVVGEDPDIETYLGFVETRRDPAHASAEFEGFVGFTNKGLCSQFTRLLSDTERLSALLPWPKEYEKNTLIQPRFKIVDLLLFAGSGVRKTKNIPAYGDICEAVGFKCLIFSNLTFPIKKDYNDIFLLEDDLNILKKHNETAQLIQLWLHKVMGHGSGKLFRKLGERNFNFPVRKMRNPITKDKVRSWYERNESFSSKFGDLSSTYEECRAECVGLYLCLNRDIINLFEVPDEDVDDVIYAIWLNLVYTAAIDSLLGYDYENNRWTDPFYQAVFVILRVLLDSGDSLVRIVETEHGKSISIRVNRSKIFTVGKKVIGDFATKLQIFKSTTDVESAQSLFSSYSTIPEEGKNPLGRWRPLTLANRRLPIEMYVHSNTLLVKHEEEDDTDDSDNAIYLLDDLPSKSKLQAVQMINQSFTGINLSPKTELQTLEVVRVVEKDTPNQDTKVLNKNTNTRQTNPPNSMTVPEAKTQIKTVEDQPTLIQTHHDTEQELVAQSDPHEEPTGALVSDDTTPETSEPAKTDAQEEKEREAIEENRDDGKHDSAGIKEDIQAPIDTKDTSESENKDTTDEGNADKQILESIVSKHYMRRTESLLPTKAGVKIKNLTKKQNRRKSRYFRDRPLSVEDVSDEQRAIIQSLYEDKYIPLLPEVSVSEIHRGRGIALELMEKILKYGEENIGSHFELLIKEERKSPIVEITATEESVETLRDGSDTPSLTTLMRQKKKDTVYPMVNGLPEGINLKRYPLSASGVVSSFLDKVPRDMVDVLTELLFCDQGFLESKSPDGVPLGTLESNAVSEYGSEEYLRSLEYQNK
uniref:Uncharacterized protein n=1 Tax=Timema cristinae TaxID=61476 RepID=A0A7R9CPU1_TIMCR|nr:unnamed protein product [Timema cristinae]